MSLAAWSGCVGDDPATASGEGAQGQACFANGTCLAGLACQSGTCRVPGSDVHTASDGGPEDTADAHETAQSDATKACASAYRDAVLADGPYAYWRMNTAAGVTIADETSNKNDLTLAGGGFILGAPGALGCDPDPAVRFDGKGAYAFASDAFSRSVDFGNREAFSIELWARREEPDSGASFFHVFGDKVGTTNKVGYLFYFSAPTNQMFLEYDWTAGSQSLTAPSKANAYVYYVATFDGTTLSLYADGALVDSGGPVQAMGERTQPFVLARETGIENHNFPGAIDEVAIYKKALSAQAVSSHYLAAKQQ